MPEINNSLALAVKADQPDVLGTLGKAAEFRAKNAYSASTEQATQHNSFLYDQGGGYTPTELNTQAETAGKYADVLGRVGNILSKDQSPAARKMAIDLAVKAKLPNMDNPLFVGHLMGADNAQIQQYGKNAQYYGQSAAQDMESSGQAAGARSRETAPYEPSPLEAGKPYPTRAEVISRPTQAQVEGAISSGRNFNGSPRVLSTADIVSPPAGGSVPGGPPLPRNGSQPPLRADNVAPFQPSVVRGPGGIPSSSVTPETVGMQGAAVDRFKQMQETASRAQGMHSQLDALEHDNEVLNTAGWSSTGAGANAKLSAAKSINSLFETVGLKAPIDPSKVASWEGYNKQSIRAGFELARTLGGHQAESVVQSSVNATPNVENTYFGSKVITNSIRQTIQRETDLYNFSLEKAKTTGTSFGAEAEFNKKFPPKLYSQTAIANAIPQTSVDRLRSTGDAKNKNLFDATYGRGMADFVLGQGQH